MFWVRVIHGSANFVSGGRYDLPKRTWQDGTWEAKYSYPSPMPEGRWSADGAVVIGDKFYLPGGWKFYVGANKALPMDNVWSYSTNQWDSNAGPPLPHHLGGSGSGCGASGNINNHLYVTSPETGMNGYHEFLDMLDMSTPDKHNLKWESRASPAAAHACGAFGVIDGKLYVAGGTTGGQTDAHITPVTEVYDPETDKWTPLAPMPIAVQNPGSAVGCGKLFVVGGIRVDGENKYKVVPTVQVYEPPKSPEDHQGRWIEGTIPPLPSARQGLGAVVVDGDLYVLGGRDEHDKVLDLVQAIGVCK